MKKVNQFWQDVDLAIATLILRHKIRRIIIEGRENRLPCLEKVNNLT